jgi:hypothetical protein
MEKRGVWEIIDEKNIPINRQCIKNEWIFKVKRNGIFQARLVACGYSQVPGIDFCESFTPVLNDVSFRIMLIAKLVWNMTSTVVTLKQHFYMVIWMKKFTWKFLKVLKLNTTKIDVEKD